MIKKIIALMLTLSVCLVVFNRVKKTDAVENIDEYITDTGAIRVDDRAKIAGFEEATSSLKF